MRNTVRSTLVATALLAVAVGTGLTAQDPPPPTDSAFEVVEAGIPELQDALESGRTTSVELVDAYRARIAAYDQTGPALNAMVRLDPEARRVAAERDRERAEGRLRGPLHGIPVLLKDNYDTEGLPTTASTLALAGHVPPDDAYQVRRLREAGAVILGKTNLHELASGITTVSSLGGRTRNPYDPARNPGGSSGGTGAAVAASFAAVGWGSDTCGSIRIPAAVNNLFGLRPTKGLSSIDGIIPLSHTQDTGGPLARTTTDLAIALDATVGPDPADPATGALGEVELPSFRESLDPGALRGARIGTVEPWLGDGEVTDVVRAALEEMEAEGAEVVAVELPELDSLLERTSLIAHEFKFDLADYLAATPGAPVGSLGRILELGLHHEALDGVLRRWDRIEEEDSEEYRERLRRQEALRGEVLRILDEQDLDALAYPTIREPAALIGAPAEGSTCSLSAHSGLPALSVPAGFTPGEIPVGLELLGRPFQDHRLLALAHAFEGTTDHRRTPLRTPPLRDGRPPGPVRFGATSGEDPSPRARPAPASDAAEDEAPTLVGTFTLDRPAGALDYRIVASGVEPGDVHAIVLERRRGERRPRAVVRRLSGPGAATAEGTLELPAHLLHDLAAGHLDVGLYTREHPLGAARIRLAPPPAR